MAISQSCVKVELKTPGEQDYHDISEWVTSVDMPRLEMRTSETYTFGRGQPIVTKGKVGNAAITITGIFDSSENSAYMKLRDSWSAVLNTGPCQLESFSVRVYPGNGTLYTQVDGELTGFSENSISADSSEPITFQFTVTGSLMYGETV